MVLRPHPNRAARISLDMRSPGFLGTTSLFASYADAAPLGDAAAQGVVSGLLSYLLPSPFALVWLLTGFAAGVAIGCFGATALRPCAALHALPVVVAVAALYAIAYLS